MARWIGSDGCSCGETVSSRYSLIAFDSNSVTLSSIVSVGTFLCGDIARNQSGRLSLSIWRNSNGVFFSRRMIAERCTHGHVLKLTSMYFAIIPSLFRMNGRRMAPVAVRSNRNRRAGAAASEPLAQFDAEAVRVADLGPGIGVAHHRAPDDLDAFPLQVLGRFLHVVDFQRDHSVAEMLQPRRRVDRHAFVRDQLDDGAAEVEIHEVQRRAAGPLDAVAHLDAETEHIGVE